MLAFKLRITQFFRRLSLASFLAVFFAGPAEFQAAQRAVDHTHAQPIRLPEGYREWRLISVAHEAGTLDDLRAILANDLATQAFRSNAGAFPEGSQIVRLAWRHVTSVENNRAFGRNQSFVAGEPTNIQLMVKDTKRYAATDGWGFAQFAEPTGNNEVTHPEACSTCHVSAQQHGYVFTRYSR